MSAQYYTGSHLDFGQNRVQYNEFFWQSYNFERFKVFFHGDGKNHAVYAAKSAHKSLINLEELLDFNLKQKVEILVFNSQSQFQQSNIGLTNDNNSNIGGVTKIVGSKIFVFYEGDHRSLDQQIKSGLTEILLQQLMYGGNWKDVLKNNTLLSLPDWYLKGFIAYAGKGWSTEIDNLVKDGILADRFVNFNALQDKDAELAGQAIWNYIAEVYGENVIPNVLYMTRVSRSVESGFLFVLGTSLKTIMLDYQNYYKRKYRDDENFRGQNMGNQLTFKTKKKYNYNQFKLSPDGRYASFVTNEDGQYKVWLYDLEDDKLRKIHKGGLDLNRIVDRTFPVLSWHPTSKALTYFVEKKGEVLINIYSVEDKKTTRRPLLGLTKVLSAQYSADGKFIIMSAAKKGQTDLFLYKVIGNSQEQLTNDIYDDLYPSFVDNSDRIIFSSNRESDTIRKNRKVEIKAYNENMDIFIFNRTRSAFLTRLTRTPKINETQPFQISKNSYMFLSNESGITNRFVASYDSLISHIDTVVHYKYFSVIHPVTNYSRSILEQDVSGSGGVFSELIFKEGQFQFYIGQADNNVQLRKENIMPTHFMKHRLGIVKLNIFNIDTSDIIVDSSATIDINNYQFEDDEPAYEKEVVTFEEPPQPNHPDSSIVVQFDEKVEEEVFVLPRQDLYTINFTSDYIVSQLDNSFLNQSYQRFAPGIYYSNPGFNGMIKFGIIDLMEDHRIIGGVRFPANFNSNEYLICYEDLRHRLDKKYMASRQTFTRFYDNRVDKVQTYDAKYNLKYPFSEVSSIRATANLRADRNVTQSTDQTTLNIPNSTDYWGGFKLDYVYDHAIPLGLNLYRGLRMKFWGEVYRELNEPKTDLFTVGGDIRHYTRIWRNMVWANRVAGSTSFGNRKLVYYLGGVDNWLLPKFDNSIQIDPNNNYFFQTIATPVRGFFQNARNGNSFAVINSELRIPIIKMLTWKPMKSDFAENFMIVGFADAGAAWTGVDPYSAENSFNTTVVRDGNLLITIENQKEPIIYGYGFGLRSRLFGYYVRFDWSWGVDDGVLLPSVKYLSLSMDF
ncbi:hypothetical protein OAW23_05325 [Flavobacteriales bacterium]|nr:hypothetical protein [Flavobacteriales bacterium]